MNYRGKVISQAVVGVKGSDEQDLTEGNEDKGLEFILQSVLKGYIIGGTLDTTT